MIIVYFGADYGCGCTMISCSTANSIAKNNPDKKILLMSLSGDSGSEYTNLSFSYGLDDIHIKLKSMVLTGKELESMCSIKKNLYMLQGSKSLKERKEYMPEEIQQLMNIAKDNFDYVIADAGSSVDLGMGIGALQSGGKNVLVTTQSPKTLARYANKESILSMLDIKFQTIVINRFLSKHFLPSERAIKEHFNIEESFPIDYSDYRLQAEIDKVGLEQLDKSYKGQIEELAGRLVHEEPPMGNTRRGILHILKGGGNV